MTGKYAAPLAFLVLLVTPDASFAEHEIYYRYTVLGYVKVATGKARPRIEVKLVRLKTGFPYLAETDETGFYVIVARLGDESVGEKLRLAIAKATATITARFDPADRIHERGTRVDFVGSRPVETPAAFRATLERFLAR